MEFLAGLFVTKPFNIFLVGLVFAAIYLATFRKRPSKILLSATLLWMLYAAWEWLVNTQTPEADIRVDLLIIWPILGLVSIWALISLLIRKK